jgi:hypothetical protein
LFAALLLTDPFVENREVGLALFREQAVWMKAKILGFIKGKTVFIRQDSGEKIKRGKKEIKKMIAVPKKVGLEKSIPTCLRTEIRDYLHWLESDPTAFDAVVMRNGKDLKSLYFARGKQAFAHSDRAQKILFKKEYPEDSKLNVFKEIENAPTPDVAAKLIVENKIPFVVAIGLIKKVTPSILVALINSMSSQEVINNIASLKEKGAWDNPELKKLIEAKLEKAQKATKVSALKSKTAVGTGRIKDEALIQKLDQVADAQVKKGGGIKVNTAVFVDRSGSLQDAIEVGKRISALISGATTAEIYVIAFDDAPMEVKCEGTTRTLSDWERAFKVVRPGGNTSIGCALQYLMKKRAAVDQIVVVTDEGENAHPLFHTVYADYCREMKVTPNVVIVHVGKPYTTFGEYLRDAKIPFDHYKPDGNDYYGLPGLIPLLSKKTKLDFIMEIMDTPLLKRKKFR